MIFLLSKIFVYLVLAAVIGAFAGWLLRNLKAQQREESAQRELSDMQAQMSQVESLLRGRDEQLSKMKLELNTRLQETSHSGDRVSDLERELSEQKREVEKWRERAQLAQAAELLDGVFDHDVGEDDDVNEVISALSQEIIDLKQKLETQQQAVPVDANRVDEMNQRVAELEKQLVSAEEALKQERVMRSDLERERELQNQSLKVLHRQLKLDRTDSARDSGP